MNEFERRLVKMYDDAIERFKEQNVIVSHTSLISVLSIIKEAKKEFPLPEDADDLKHYQGLLEDWYNKWFEGKYV